MRPGEETVVVKLCSSPSPVIQIKPRPLTTQKRSIWLLCCGHQITVTSLTYCGPASLKWLLCKKNFNCLRKHDCSRPMISSQNVSAPCPKLAVLSAAPVVLKQQTLHSSQSLNPVWAHKHRTPASNVAQHHALFEHTYGCEPAKEAMGVPTSLHTAATPTQIKQWTVFTTRSSVTPGTTVILPVWAANMQLLHETL